MTAARASLFAAAAATLLVAAAASAAPAEYTLQSDHHVGRFPTKSPSSNVARAVSVFGAPSSKRRVTENQCRVVWRARGLSMLFLDFDRAHNPCRTGDFVQGTTIGRAWHTAVGLRIGDSVTRLRRLFPRARRVTGTGPNDGWWLVTRRACGEVGGDRFPGLLARTNRAGRVAAFVVQRGVCD